MPHIPAQVRLGVNDADTIALRERSILSSRSLNQRAMQLKKRKASDVFSESFATDSLSRILPCGSSRALAIEREVARIEDKSSRSQKGNTSHEETSNVESNTRRTKLLHLDEKSNEKTTLSLNENNLSVDSAEDVDSEEELERELEKLRSTKQLVNRNAEASFSRNKEGASMRAIESGEQTDLLWMEDGLEIISEEDVDSESDNSDTLTSTSIRTAAKTLNPLAQWERTKSESFLSRHFK